jgi:ABC-type Fe3+-hydroxamate transport system substrate-binding protein
MLKTFTDQMQREVTVLFPPKRIISLVPSQTELLSSLGLDREVVGITKFCLHPDDWLTRKVVVGGTKKIDHKIIASLEPDLIIGNKEENERLDIEVLQNAFPVWMSDIVTFEDAFDMMASVGAITNKVGEAEECLQNIKASFGMLYKAQPKKVLYLIWRKPWMAAGTGTFIHSWIEKLGFKNVVNTPRYPVLTDHDITQLQPELILLSSEPFPFAEKHLNEIRRLYPHAHPVLVDGEMFSWYGTRLEKAPSYFNTLLHNLKLQTL